MPLRFLFPLLALLYLALVVLFAHFGGRPGAQAAPVAQAATSGARFTVTDLGEIPEARKLVEIPDATAPNGQGAVALNDQGQVVGGFAHAFLWDQGRAEDLGTLPTGDSQETQVSTANAINNQGQVVGISGSFEPIMLDDVESWGFLYTNKAMHHLPEAGDYNRVTPDAINDAGQIVGDDDHTYQAFFYANGRLIALGALSERPGGDGGPDGNYSTAQGINKQGQVVGWSTAPGPDHDNLPTHAFLWQRKGRSGGRSGRMRDLGTLPGYTDSSAFGINRRGGVVGTATGAHDKSRAFLWRRGRMKSLGTLPGSHDSEALGLDDAGAVVGRSDGRAVLWENGVMRDLTALIPAGSGWALEEARAINNKGQIAGNGQLHGQHHAFLLTPQVKSPR